MYIIIIGCGRLGSHLANVLADDGNDICIIDRSADKLNDLGSGFNGQRIKGIEFDSDILIEAGVKQADALLAVTSNDNINITVSLIAERIFKVPKIVARVNDPGKKSIYFQLGIDTINPIQYEIEIIKSQLFLKSDSNANLARYFVDKGESL
ncbi:MAG TPA: NAD-binding protein [Lachnospiraceae bacterium]|nr:NAD-binding protein [Lachnospiraceae bacterium]HEX3078702.1 NAD-binding protein [Lachnospiraceae bacterium]